MRPNIFLGMAEGSAQYKKWYFELVIDQVDHFVTGEPTHLRVGWANTRGYAPYPGGGEGWGGNGVGDDLYSYSFDGLHLWSGRCPVSKVHFWLFRYEGDGVREHTNCELAHEDNSNGRVHQRLPNTLRNVSATPPDCYVSLFFIAPMRLVFL